MLNSDTICRGSFS